MQKFIRLMSVIALLALTLAWMPGSAAAAGTSISIANVSVYYATCDTWAVDADIDITVDVPGAGTYADMHYKFVIGGVTLLDWNSGLGMIGPGPTTATELSWGVGDSGPQSYPANTPIHVVYYDANSGAYAGFSVDCTTEAVLSIYSSEQGGAAAPGPGPDMVPIPDQAVSGAFVSNTVIYFAPQADAATDIVMEAGKTVWVYGLDESGAYYKVMLSGKLFWVPVSSIGPNYDEVWNGTPLPTEVVE